MIFSWHTEAISGYRPGSVTVCAPDVETARAVILADFDRWVRSEVYSDHAPYVSGCFDATQPTGFASWMDDYDIEESREQIEAHRKTLTDDLANDPITVGPGGVVYHFGGD